MFKYELEINPDEMLVKIVPFLENSEHIDGIKFGQRRISYKDSFGRVLFFNIWNFPDYLRCEDFPWERLENLNEAINFITMYNQYNELAKSPEQSIWWKTGWSPETFQTLKPYFTPPFDITSSPMMISCSCLCSRDR